jgi:hypothetical protein
VSGGYGYGPHEATLPDAERAHAALEAISTSDPRWQTAWDQAFTTSRSYFRSVQRDREQRQRGVDAALQGDLFGGSEPPQPRPEAGQ